MSTGPAVEFFGVRGSYPAVGPQYSRFGGNTSSISITVAGRRLVFDGGSGMIPLGQRAWGERNLNIFMTHLHYDHLIGLPFFAPFFGKGDRVRIYTPATMMGALKAYWRPPYFPLAMEDYPASIEVLPTPEGNVDLSALLGLPDRTGRPRMKTMFLGDHYHPRDGVMLHRISYNGKDVVYATDIEIHSDRALDTVAEFSAGVELLICDTQYDDAEYEIHHQGWGHNSIEMATRLAQRAGAKELILFHHAPDRTDQAMEALEEQARERFPNTRAAYEGLLVQL